MKLKEHRIIEGKGNKKENKKNGIGKRQEFLGGRGVLKNKNKNLEDIEKEKSKSETPPNNPRMTV